MQTSSKAAALSRSMVVAPQPEPLQRLTIALVNAVTPLVQGRAWTPKEFAVRDRRLATHGVSLARQRSQRQLNQQTESLLGVDAAELSTTRSGPDVPHHAARSD